MGNAQRLISVILSLAIATSFALFVVGCKETTDGPPAVTPITEDLFPLVAGRKIIFSGYLRAPGADTNWTATGAFYENRMTIGLYNGFTAPGPPTGPGGTCTAVSDSNRVSPPNTWSVGALLFQKASASGAADFSYLGSLASFYRIFYPSTGASGTTRTDSLRWLKLTDLASGIGKEYTCYDSTYNVTTPTTTTARIHVVGKVEGTETLTLAGTTFSTYKITISRRVYVGGSLASEGQTAQLWVAANIGPVKMVLGADDRNYGSQREFKSKNF